MKRAFALVVAVLTASALGFSFAERTSHGRTVAIKVAVRGHGSIVAGGLACRSRCRWRFQRGSRKILQARPEMGHQFRRWRGACSSRRSNCAIRLKKDSLLVAVFEPITRLASWSTHVSCTPLRTTIPQILGTQENAEHGATEAGGSFQPHLRGGEQQHLLNPPCEVRGTPTFVEIHDVVITRPPNRSGDGDDSTNLTQAGRSDIANPYMKMIHAEIDGTWITAAVAPPLWPTTVGTRLDVQGFVFWDPAHTDDAWHGYSGWELHPVAAWRWASSRELR